MRINVCIPTRGKPDYLAKFTDLSLKNSTLDTTRFVIGLDDDDKGVEYVIPRHTDKIISSTAKREDALGAKYNRCAAAYDADLYVMGLDDVGIATPGWDEKLAEAASQFKDGIGCVYFGQEPHGEDMPSMQAVTRRMVDLMGFFVVPHFPFWWGNTSLHEIAHFVDRIRYADIETAYPEKFPAPPRRDILFWAKFFDDTRQWRWEVAQKLIAEMDEPESFKKSLFNRASVLSWGFAKRNSCLRDPQVARVLEQGSLPDPLDERHMRLKAAAMSMLRKAA